MKKMISKLMVGAVVLSVLAPSASYAATTITDANTTKQQAQQQEKKHEMKQMTAEERQANHEKLMEIIKKYTPELADQFQAIFDEQETTRVKVDAIREQVKAGTLTKEEAQAKLKELGLDLGDRDRGLGHKDFGGHKGGHNGHFAQLDEAVTNNDEAKVKEILTQMLTDMQARNKTNN